ncbi:MAG: hypothetical protein P0120_23175 [Nitrospira sp.]|nr:hypothetical protein [Nitrospira sp.]
MDHVIHRQGRAGLNGCGKLPLTSGPITRHFEREEFQAFAEVLSRLDAQVPGIQGHLGTLTRWPGTETICH